MARHPHSAWMALGNSLVVALAMGGGPVAAAQNPAEPDALTPGHSMGLPHAFRPYGALGAGVTARGPGATVLTRATIGLSRDITNPTPGLIGMALEGWLGSRARKADGGVRLLLGFPAAGLHAALDYSARVNHIDPALTVWYPFRRGGILLPGGGVRLDWIPRQGALLTSIQVPFGQHAGRTRPRVIDVPPPPAPDARQPPAVTDPALQQSLARIRESARWIARLTLVPLPPGPPERSHPVALRLAGHLTGHPAAAEVSAYHSEVAQAFALAAGGSAETSAAAAGAARRVLLDEVLLPWDRDLGRIRRPGVLPALRRRAAAVFAGRLEALAELPAGRRPQAEAVFEGLTSIVQEVADSLIADWGDSRLVWLPLQLALRPEEHDSQSELDALLARITGRPFLAGHDLDYATDERFEPALLRSILDAREYHVLWIHDFAGRDPAGRPDTVAEEVVLHGYLAALERAAREFDQSHRVPAFIILLDRYYYRRSVSDRWLELLQDPLGYHFRLRGRFHTIEVRVRAAQARLREAVAASSALQAEARQRGGDRWLRRLFAVQVNVTNPPDASFRGPALPGSLGGLLPDDIMRDHRKVAFADVDEADPTRGIALLTGLGVGESYARFRWLDRTVVLRGPTAATLKSEARELLRSQGVPEDRIPPALLPSATAHRGVVTPPGWSAKAAIVMNATGYGPKSATAAKAALYSLMPPGSTIVANDPQWLSRFWGGMLLGSALQGAKVLIIGPGPDNAPFGGAFIQRVLQRDLFQRLLDARDVLRTPLAAAGGMLQLGLFRIGLGTYNVPGGVRGVRDGLRRHPFIREALPFDRGVWELFEQADSLLQALGASEADNDSTYHPKFHLKTQFFGTQAAMREAVGRPEWRAFFARRIGERLHESPAGTDITLRALAPIRPYLDQRSAAARERQGLYLSVGSHNQDNRSLMLDGEAVCLVSGEAALVSVGDMLLLSTVGVEWLETPAELDRSFPPWDETRTEAARALEALF